VSSLRRGSLCQSRPPEGSLNGICDFPRWSHGNKCSTATHKSETRFAFHRPIPGRQVEFFLQGYSPSPRVSNSIQISIADKRQFVTVKRAATSVNPNPHETLLSVFLADIRLSVDSGTYAGAFGLPTSTGSIPSRATEFTMIRLVSAGLSEVLPVLCATVAGLY
jgi:hypothetical protein